MEGNLFILLPYAFLYYNKGQSQTIPHQVIFDIYPFSYIRKHIADYADNFALPLALLAAKTFLPPAELILALKP